MKNASFFFIREVNLVITDLISGILNFFCQYNNIRKMAYKVQMFASLVIGFSVTLVSVFGGFNFMIVFELFIDAWAVTTVHWKLIAYSVC